MVSFTVIIITQGREELLLKCLASLAPPVESWQLIILGNSQPLSEKIKDQLHILTSDLEIIETEEPLTPGRARNMSLLKVNPSSDWVFFLDDDAYLLAHYWKVALPLLSDSRIDVLGGPDVPAPEMRSFGHGVAIALSSPFCTGATFIRHQRLGTRLLSADEGKLSSCNLWVRKSALDEVRFPEDYLRTEESYFLQVLKKKKHGLFYHPELNVAHFRRSRFIEIIRPTYFAGYFRSRLLKEKLSTGDELFWLPSIFVLMHFILFIDAEFFWTLARLYLLAILAISLALCLKAKRIWLTPLVMILHYYIVFIYGLGFMTERVGKKWK